MAQAVELGLDTFGDVTVDAHGTLLTQAQVLRHVVEEGALADRMGLHFFGVGEQPQGLFDLRPRGRAGGNRVGDEEHLARD